MRRVHVAVYPGTFDPLHLGHLDIIRRASQLVDRLIVGVAINVGKEPLFPLEERVRMVRGEIDALYAANAMNGIKVEVVPFENLLMHFAADQGADMVIRGLRAVTDFDYEFQMAQINRHLDRAVDTVYLPASAHWSFLSSSGVREVAAWGGAVDDWVPPHVAEALRERHDQIARTGH